MAKSPEELFDLIFSVTVLLKVAPVASGLTIVVFSYLCPLPAAPLPHPHPGLHPHTWTIRRSDRCRAPCYASVIQTDCQLIVHTHKEVSGPFSGPGCIFLKGTRVGRFKFAEVKLKSLGHDTFSAFLGNQRSLPNSNEPPPRETEFRQLSRQTLQTPFTANTSGTDLWLFLKQETSDPDSPPIRTIIALIPRRF